MEKTKQRLEQLGRQGIVPMGKLPILLQAMSALHMGKQLKPVEREILSKYMHNMTDIMLKDTTVFNRAKLHTQRTKYQTEETTVNEEDVKIVDGPDDEEEMRNRDERKARRLGRKSKADKLKMLPRELRKEKEKAGVSEEIQAMNNAYQEAFEATLAQFEYNSVRDLPASKKAEFFTAVDAALEEAKMAKKDHDGDGKIETSTDEYLGSRDKAIKKAMKKEEVEQVDELKKSTLSSYIQKAADPVGKKSNVNLASKAAHKLATSDDMNAGEKEDRKAFVRSKGIQTAAKKLAKEEVAQEDISEAGNPGATPARYDMIKKAAEKIQGTGYDKKAAAAAKRDMKAKGAQKGMAPVKKDDVEEETNPYVDAVAKAISENKKNLFK